MSCISWKSCLVEQDGRTQAATSPTTPFAWVTYRGKWVRTPHCYHRVYLLARVLYVVFQPLTQVAGTTHDTGTTTRTGNTRVSCDRQAANEEMELRPTSAPTTVLRELWSIPRYQTVPALLGTRPYSAGQRGCPR